MSERRACLLVAADRKMVRYRSRRPPDVELRTRLRDLANRRCRFGYRRLFILLREQGGPSGINHIYRMQFASRASRRAIGTRTPILAEA
jgi:putative transposase